jgi:serine protease AprX
MVIAAMTLAVAPAVYAGKSGSGSSTSGPTACSNLSKSTTLADVNAAIGATAFQTGKLAITGAGVDIAVIDTGVAPLAGLKAIDGPDLSFDALNPALRFGDLHGHGTNMAGIVAGVAPGSRIVDVKVGAADGAVDVSQVIAGIDWVVENRNANGMNIRVINLAYDTDAATNYVTDPLTRAVENAWQKGIVVVVAGGNDGRAVKKLGNPAFDPFVIAVGAAELKSVWKVPSFTSTGDGVRNPDIVAPGSSVLSLGVSGSYLASTYPAATCVDSKGKLFLRGSGTSQAAAVVAGSAALLLESRPTLTPNQVKALLKTTATVLVDDQQPSLPPYPVDRQGDGMLNVAAALTAPTPSLTASAQWFTPASGGGSLEAARGSAHVGADGDQLTGEYTAYGAPFDSAAHSARELLGTTWANQIWIGGTWKGGTWSGATWSGASWSGASWSGATWSGASWSGATWSGASWSGATWSGASWSGATWSGATWSGATWSGASWS